MVAMKARWAGVCGVCRKPFEAGSQIKYDGPGKTYHPQCMPQGNFGQGQRTQALAHDDPGYCEGGNYVQSPEINF